MKLKIVVLIIVIIMASAMSYAEDSKTVENFDLEPIVLNSENSENSTLGIQYNVDGKLLDRKFVQEEGDDLNPDAIIGGADISYSLKGTVTEDFKTNPKSFSESRISANYFRSSSFSMKAGVFIEMESDQRFDDSQFVYGLTATAAKIDAVAPNDIVALHLNIGQVDPSEDKAREAILGSDLDVYGRIDFEFLYIYPIGTESLDTLEVNFRFFKEIDAETSIEEANLDEFRFITYRLGFKNKLFVAYSAGELPFNQQADQIYEVGFSYKFK